MDALIKNRNIIEKIVYYITLGIFILFILMFSILSVIQSSYMSCAGYDRHMIYTNYFTIRSIVFFILIICFFILIKLSGYKISSKKVLIIEMVLFSIVGMQAIYTYQYILLLLPLSAYGFKTVSNKIKI